MFFHVLKIIKSIRYRPDYPVLAVLFILFLSCQDLEREKTGNRTSNKKLEAIPTEIAAIETPEEALTAMKAGHARYKNGQFEHIHIKRVITEAEEESHPFVAIITCPDFKIPAEILFDLDKQNILLLESPANTENENITRVLQTKLENKRIKLILVLGHSNCEAISNIVRKELFVDTLNIKEQITAAIPVNNGDTVHMLEKTILNNIKLTMTRIASKNIIDSMVKKGALEIKGAYYDNSDSGKLLFDDDFK